MAEFKPAEVFPPGEFLRDELESRGWSQGDFAEITRRPIQAINEILSGRRGITPEMARRLGAALGTSAELWMNLQSAYDLSLVETDDNEVKHRAKLYEFAPVKDMISRHWIEACESTTDLERELEKFFGVKSLDQTPQLTFAARKGTPYANTTPEQLAWAFRVKNLGKAVHASRFNAGAFEEGLTALRNLIAHEADVQRVPKILAEMGVRLVIVEHLPKSRMDGVALWLDKSSPVIGLSIRYDRIDYFWFCLLHELMHVLHGDAISIDENLVGESFVQTEDKPECEQRADREAAERLVEGREIESFIVRVGPSYYRSKVMQFANRVRVHPGIIVGQLQRRGELKYSQFRDTLIKIRHLLTGAMIDGWGLMRHSR